MANSHDTHTHTVRSNLDSKVVNFQKLFKIPISILCTEYNVQDLIKAVMFNDKFMHSLKCLTPLLQ